MVNSWCYGVALVMLLWRVPLSSCGEFDQSTVAFCPGDQFPEVGTRVCYRRTVAPNECNVVSCSVEAIERTRGDISLLANTYKIASPRFYREDGTYQNQRLCQYNIQSCPTGTIAHIEWARPMFTLEDSQNVGLFELCLDYVRLFNFDLRNAGVELDAFNRICGNPEDFSMRISGTPVQVEFRSDNKERFRGFRMDIVCTPVVTENVINITGSGGSQAGGALGRRRRDSEEGRAFRTKRGAVRYKMTEMNCTEVEGEPLPPPSFVDPNSIPQKGDRFQVPRAAFLTYWEDVLRLVQGDQVLRYIPGIQRLLFWTGFNGTRVFEGTALVPEDEIFGGGQVLIVKNCAYYTNFMSPPRLEPNLQELALVSILTNATTPFFADQDIDDEDPEPPTTPPTKPPPSTKPPPPHYTTTTKHPHYVRPPHTTAPTKPPTTSPPDTDPRVDPEALELAVEFVNACNIYLRQSARAFLEILEQEGLFP